jgi:ketosteroid isomerase-like protein
MTPREVFALKEKRVLQFDMAGQADLFAEDGVMEFPFAPAGTPRRLEGRDAIRDILGGAVEWAKESGMRLLDHGQYTIHDTTDPEVIVVEFDAHGRVGTDGETRTCPYLQVLRVRNGEIVLFRDYWSMETAQPFWGLPTAEALKEH